MEETAISDNKQESRPWLFKKGQSGNPKGRTPGSKTLKTRVKDYLMSLNDDEFIEYLDGMNKIDVWKMAEGNPDNNDKSKVEVTLVKPIADAFVQDSKQHEENSEPKETN